MKLKGRYMNVVIANMWHRRCKRWGPSTEFNNTNFWRRHVTFFAMPQVQVREQQSLAMLKVFLKENIGIERFKIAMREFYRNINLIQKKMRDACVAKEAKVEVLFNYWDKMYGQI